MGRHFLINFFSGKSSRTLVALFFCCSFMSVSAYGMAVPRLSRNGFVSAAGLAPKSSNIATGWTMGFPVGGVSEINVNPFNIVKLTAGYWSKLALANPPPPPSIASPTVVLSDETGEYDCYDESSLQISGQKTPTVHYQFNSLVIAYTNDVELPLTAINQISNQSIWSMDLPINEGDIIELSLISSNMFGLSTTRTVMLITQIPEPVLLLLPIILMLLFRRHSLSKKLITSLLLVVICTGVSQSQASKFNYRNIHNTINVENDSYPGFKSVVSINNDKISKITSLKSPFNIFEIIEGSWYNILLATTPPPPSIAAPVVVLSDETGEYDCYDEDSLEISGQKSPNVQYQYNSLIIAYTNNVKLPASAINQVPNQSIWSIELPLSEGDIINLSLISSNLFGMSTSRTVILITQIPEPALLLLPFILLFFFRKRSFNKKFLFLSLLTILFFNTQKSSAAEFNYQGVVEIEGGAYAGDGYFKFVIGDKNETTNYWSNDGSSTGEPAAYVQINVENGFFNVPLGGSGMTAIPRKLFSNESNLYLSVWFNFKPDGTYLRLGPAQKILSVPTAVNADLLDGYDYNEIISNTVTSMYNSGFATLTTVSNMFLLKSGDVCTGQLQVSNLVSDTNIELPDDGRVYLNTDKSAYISSGSSGNVTIFKNNQPVFEIE